MNFMLIFGDALLGYTTAAAYTLIDSLILFNMQRRGTQILLVIQIRLGNLLLWICTERP
jgi:hypothetical protein